MRNSSSRSSKEKAVVLLSGGLDSAVALYSAKKQGLECYCLIFDYGQRHKKEAESAKRIARYAGCAYQVLKIKFPWKGSSLLDRKMKIPASPLRRKGPFLPSTYVPARNTIFLSFALSWAEALGARRIYIGAHIEDYPGYPDCRPGFLDAFAGVARRGTGMRLIKIVAPLIRKNKSQIIKLGMRLKVPLALTWSCYKGGRLPCGRCDSCFFRKKGFKQAKVPDPVVYKEG